MAANTNNFGAIDPRSISFEAILNDLVEHVRSLPEADRWNDYFAFSEGATILELIAGLGSFLKYEAVITRRESSHLTARLRSTIYAMADLFGYPPNRSQSPRLTITINMERDIFWNRDVPIGTLGSSQVSLIRSQQLTRGSNTVEVVLGTWIERTVTSDTGRPFAEFPFQATDAGSGVSTIDDIDNQLVEIYVNDNPVLWTRYVEELNETNQVQLRTLAFNISVIFGSDDLGLTINNGDVIRFRYLAVDNTNRASNNFVLNQLSITIDGGTATSIATTSPRYPADTLEKIVRLLPGYYSAQRNAVNAEDHASLLASYPGIISARWVYGFCVTDNNLNDGRAKRERDCTRIDPTNRWIPASTTCCEATLSYLFQDEHVADLSEQEEIFQYMDQFIMPGESIRLIDPQPVLLNFVGSVTISPGTDTDLLSSRVRATIDLHCNQLGGNFKLVDLLDAISNLEGVVNIYVQVPNSDLVLSNHQYLRRGAVNLTFDTNRFSTQQFGTSSSGEGFSGLGFSNIEN